MSNNITHTRHTLAHLLARAVLEKYPEAKLTLGPDTDNGFYYDIDFGDAEFSDENLKKIETNMKNMLADWETFQAYEVTADEARDFFSDNEYKLELIDEIAEANEQISLYYSGPKDEVPDKSELLSTGNRKLENNAFVDLCRGGHIDNPSKEIEADSFTLDTVAGAYWRGDEDNQMLTRIYGLAFRNEEDLRDFQEKREQAKKRDHRKLGKQLDLFTFSDSVGSGLPMLLPNGEIIRDQLASYVTTEKKRRNYKFVNIPHIAKRELYECSGHMGKYDAMMPTFTDESDNEYVLKAMNCPHHFEIFNSRPKSYRDLPLRIAENTTVYRNEKSGELHGLTRVKNLMQDDAHHFIRPDQIDEEIQMIIDFMDQVYERIGFADYRVQISVRDTDSDQEYFGDDEIWQRAESILVDAVTDRDIDYTKQPGEAAFYGPKIDVMVEDALGRDWQLTTIQLDFVQPDNFDMTYTGEDGDEHNVVVIHAAILGSFERFLGVLLEHTAGDLPLWLTPTQLAILPVAEKHQSFANDLQDKLTKAGFRPEVFRADDSIGRRIRKTHEQKIPLFTVVGDDEQDSHELELEARQETLADTKTTLESIHEDMESLVDDSKGNTADNDNEE